MNPNIVKAILGGIAGTLMMSLMMSFVAPMMVGQPMDIAAMLANMMKNNYGMGLTVHIMLGVLVFPLVYAFVVFRFLPGTPLIKGLTWGFILWLIAETMIMPMAGAGFFMSEIGGMKAVMAALMGHLVYGGLLGVIAGRADNCCGTHRSLA